jgi:hypothetical protein
MIYGASFGGFLLNANTTTFVNRRPISASDNQPTLANPPKRPIGPIQLSTGSTGIPKLITNSHSACASCEDVRPIESKPSKKRKKTTDEDGEMKSDQHKAMMSASDQSSSSSESEDDTNTRDVVTKKSKKSSTDSDDDTHDFHKASKDNQKSKNRCWDGYVPVEGKAPFSPNSCRKKTN